MGIESPSCTCIIVYYRGGVEEENGGFNPILGGERQIRQRFLALTIIKYRIVSYRAYASTCYFLELELMGVDYSLK